MFRPRRRLWGPCLPLSRVNIANIWNGSHGAKYLARITVTISSAPLTTTGHHNGGCISQFRSQQSAVVTDDRGQSEGWPVLHWPIRGHFSLSIITNVVTAQWLAQLSSAFRHPEVIYEQKLSEPSRFSSDSWAPSSRRFRRREKGYENFTYAKYPFFPSFSNLLLCSTAVMFL